MHDLFFTPELTSWRGEFQPAEFLERPALWPPMLTSTLGIDFCSNQQLVQAEGEI